MKERLLQRRDWMTLVVTASLGLPSAALLFSGVQINPLAAAGVYGTGILAGAFLLSWAAEVSELDISASLAIAILALLTILPEYAIEAVLAWDAGASFDTQTREVTVETQRVAANITGANRLLIGFGWSVVILAYWLKHREALDIRGKMGHEVPFLAIATLLTFVIFFMQGIHILTAAGLIGLYVIYLWIGSSGEAEEPELAGVTAMLGSLPARRRRVGVLLMFVYAATVILVSAEPFVESLIETGSHMGVDDFMLIQWVAPLASETPEIIVAVLFGLRANPAAGLLVLISSEVNKFTLLVGSMTVIFSASAGQISTFPLDNRQAVEFLLTSSVSLFGLLLIAKGTVDWRAGGVLLGLFAVHLFFPDPEHRLWMAFGYLGLAALLAVSDWRRLKFLFLPSRAPVPPR